MRHVLLDTNVILRFLRRDDPAQSPLAAALFDEGVKGGCTLGISWYVVAECVWALRSHYDAPRKDIAISLAKLIGFDAVVCDNKPVLLDALDRYGTSKLDIVDCLLAAESASGGKALATFDLGIGKHFNEISLLQWGDG